MKKGRPQKKHQPVPASFDEVLAAIGKSKYEDKRAIEKKKKKR